MERFRSRAMGIRRGWYAYAPLVVMALICWSDRCCAGREFQGVTGDGAALECLKTEARTSRGVWLPLLDGLMAAHSGARDREVARRSLFLAGKTGLSMFERFGRPADLHAAIRRLTHCRELCDNPTDMRQCSIELKKAELYATAIKAKQREKLLESESACVSAGSKRPVGGNASSGAAPVWSDTTPAGAGADETLIAANQTGNPFWRSLLRERRMEAGVEEEPLPPSPTSQPVQSTQPPAVHQYAPTAPTEQPRPSWVAPAPAPPWNPVRKPTPRPQPVAAPPTPVVEPPQRAAPSYPLMAPPRQAALQIPAIPAPPEPPPTPQVTLPCPPLAGDFVVVLDPGHGGKDPGAVTRDKKLKEKDITLDVAKRLKGFLEANHPELKVALTRCDDSFLSLSERTAFANRLSADLFISIHCNAATDVTSKGIETYVLDTAASSKEMRAAARENGISTKKMNDVQVTVRDLLAHSRNIESHKLATAVSETFRRSLPNRRNRGVKQAPFYVLLGAKAPAILVECAFLSNDKERRKLATGAYLDKIAKGLADGALVYLTERKSAPAKQTAEK